MKRMDVLRELFDEKIIKVISAFLDEPSRTFSLTQISSQAKVNIATTLRIIDKLVKKEIIDIELIGKSKFYKLKQSEKTLLLNKLLRREEQITEFLEKIKNLHTIKKIILEEKKHNEAKIIIVSSSSSTEKIKKIVEEIKSKFNFTINYLEISEEQYSEMNRLGLFNINKKIIWSKEN